jgi:hypothetical protein
MNEKKQTKDIRNRNAIIYKLVDNSNGNFYIGSTINYISNRLWKHKSKKQNHTKNSHKIIDNNNYEMIILDTMRVDDIKVLRLYESFYILIAKKYCKDRCLNGNALAYNNPNVYKIVARRPYQCPNCNIIIKNWSKSRHKQYCKNTNNTNKIEINTN